MIPLHLNSESGLAYPWFAVAAMRNSDQRFYNFTSTNFDSITGTTVNDKLGNLTADHKLNLIDGGDNWYRAEIDSLGTADDLVPTAFTLFYLDLVSGNTADERGILVLADELLTEFGARPYLGPEDPLTHPLGMLATHIANTATFRSWCGLPAEAAESSDKLLTGVGFQKRIYWPLYEQNVEPWLMPVLPVCVLMTPPADPLGLDRLTEDGVFEHKGSIDVLVLDRNRGGGSLETGGRLFMKRLGFLIEELKTIDSENDHLRINTMSVGISHEQPTPAQQGQLGGRMHGWWQGIFTVAWGV